MPKPTYFSGARPVFTKQPYPHVEWRRGKAPPTQSPAPNWLHRSKSFPPHTQDLYVEPSASRDHLLHYGIDELEEAIDGIQQATAALGVAVEELPRVLTEFPRPPKPSFKVRVAEYIAQSVFQRMWRKMCCCCPDAVDD